MQKSKFENIDWILLFSIAAKYGTSEGNDY